MKNISGMSGILILWYVLFGGNLIHLGNWSTSRDIWFNLSTLLGIVLGASLLIWGLKTRK